MRIERFIRCFLVACGLTSLTVPVRGVTPLTHYHAIRDRVCRPKPAKAPYMGPAGYVYRDPVFKSRTLRVTDGNTIRDGQNGSFHTTSASTENEFSSDSRKFFVLAENGAVIPFQFDPATMTARCYTNDLGGRLKPPAGDCSSLPLSAPEFSYVDPNVIYGLQGKEIVAYNFLENAVTEVFDVGKVVKAVPGRRLYVRDLGVSSDDNEFAVVYGWEQDRYRWAIWYHRPSKTCHVLDLYQSLLDGKPIAGGAVLGFGLHFLDISRDGNYVLLHRGTPVATTTFSKPGPVIWDVRHSRFYTLGPRPFGHMVAGYGYLINAGMLANETGPQFLIRALDPLRVNHPRELLSPVANRRDYFYEDDHASWNNAMPGKLAPFATSFDNDSARNPYRPDPRGYLYDDEIVAVATDGTRTVWRFGLNWSHSAGANGGPGDFWSTSRGNISRDGRYFLFTSNWGDGLGADALSRRYPVRKDVFLIDLETANAAGREAPAGGYILSVPAESPAAQTERHKRVAARRLGPIVIVHRGASAFAPANTLAAYAAAMDYGADGCEVDIRRTADGVLVMFHDDGLERMTPALGRVNQYTYRQLAALKFRSIYHPKPGTGIPTLAAVFELARQRAMLLHLDIKEPGLQEQIAELLDAADIWDQVVSINDYNSAELRKNPKYRPLAYKVPGMYDGRLDMDPSAVRAALAKPGNMIMVDDPRVAARALKRKVHCVPVPDDLRAPVPPALPSSVPETNSFSPPRFLRALSKRVNSRSVPELERLLTAEFPGRVDLGGNAAYQQRREARIVERAWAAEKLGQVGVKSERTVRVLERLIANRSLDRDWAYQGLDGVMAVRALGALRATQSAPMLVRTFLSVDPELKKMAQSPASYPYAWADFKLKSEIMATLGRLPCRQSKRFLLRYIAMDMAAASKFAPPLFEQATKSLLRQGVTQDELEELLRSTNSAVRGTAILECLDHPTAARSAALKAVQPWAQNLPRPGDCGKSHAPARAIRPCPAGP